MCLSNGGINMWAPTTYGSELYHHGILGQKWGIRRYQNADGTLTSAGKKRYGSESVKKISSTKGLARRMNDVDQAMAYHKRTKSENYFKSEKYAKKRNRILKKKKINDFSKRQLDKYNRKYEDAKAKMRNADKYIKEGNAETNKHLNTSKRHGYDVTAKEYLRSTARGKDWAKAGVQTVAANMGLAAVGAPIRLYYGPANYTVGTKYKVKNKQAYYNPDGSKAKRRSGTVAYKEMGKYSNFIANGWASDRQMEMAEARKKRRH